MDIDTAVGEIRTYYLNLPKDDLTEGGRFTAEVLEKLVATERAKVLSEVSMVCLGTVTRLGYKGYLSENQITQINRSLSEALAKLNQLKGNHD